VILVQRFRIGDHNQLPKVRAELRLREAVE
jgi:hypothetical protein